MPTGGAPSIGTGAVGSSQCVDDAPDCEFSVQPGCPSYVRRDARAARRPLDRHPPAKRTALMDSILLGIGANLGDRARTLDAAVVGLRRFLHITAASPVYETAPMYVEDQSPFLNMVLEVETALSPERLLGALKQLERRLGRVPGARYGPRVIDLDILFYGDRVVAEPHLEIPHPRIAERAFVLIPAAVIAPDRRHPVLGRRIAELATALPDCGDVVPWQPPEAARAAVG